MRIGKNGEYRHATGFTYVGLLIAVVIFGFGSVGAARILASSERVERERELIFIGHQFRDAIRSYVQSGPAAGRYPAKLEDLILDARFPTPRRHLRKLFADPITGKAEWVLIPAPEGGIMGVHSVSELEPLKRANFDLEDSHFVIASQPQESITPQNSAGYTYRDWQFIYRPATAGSANPFVSRRGL